MPTNLVDHNPFYPLRLRQAIADQNSAPQRDEGSLTEELYRFWDSFEPDDQINPTTGEHE